MQQAIAGHGTRITALEETVNGKPGQGTEGDDDYVAPVEGLVTKVAANTAAISKEATDRAAVDAAIRQEIADAEKRAKDYADQNDADTKYNDTELRGVIAGVSGRVTTVEEAINGKAAVGEEGSEGYVAPVKGLVARVDTVEDELVPIKAFFDGAYDEDGKSVREALDTLVEIQNFIGTDGEAASGMLKSIDDNAEAIGKLQTAVAGNGAAIKTIQDTYVKSGDTIKLVCGSATTLID
jgi:hypothetical protein